MPSLRELYEGLTVMMNYLDDDDDLNWKVRHGFFTVDGPHKDDLEAADRKKLEDAGWCWNDHYEGWGF